jgi:hypothetical protein
MHLRHLGLSSCGLSLSLLLACTPDPGPGSGTSLIPESTSGDGNQIETDACLNSCTLRTPQGC